MPRSKVKVSRDKKRHFSAFSAACVRFMFGKTSLASGFNSLFYNMCMPFSQRFSTLTSGQSNLRKRLHRQRFNGIPQVAPVCTPPNTFFLGPTRIVNPHGISIGSGGTHKLEQSFTVHVPLPVATSAFPFGRRRQSSPQRCYPHRLRDDKTQPYPPTPSHNFHASPRPNELIPEVSAQPV